MNKKILAALAVSGALLVTGAAQATSLSWVSSGTGTLDDVFNPAPTAGVMSPGATVSLGSLRFSTADDAFITFTYLGQESGFNDSLARASVAGVLLTEADAVGTTASFGVLGGQTNVAVDFKFLDSVGGSAINGGAWSPNSSIGLLGTNVTLAGYGTYAYVLGFNDSFRTSNDWDDFIIGVNIKVPEPTTLALLGLGLIGLGVSRRRK